jgi:hypothetical protein
MMKRSMVLTIVAVTLSFSLPALADQSNCPPGAWFCAEAKVRKAPAPQPEQPRVKESGVFSDLLEMLRTFVAR